MASFVLVLLLFACSVQLSYSHGRPTYVDKYDTTNTMCTLAKQYYSDYCQVNQASGLAPVRNPGKQTRGLRKPWSRNPKSRKPKSRKSKSRNPKSRNPESRNPKSRKPKSRNPNTASQTPPPPNTAPPTPPPPTTAAPTPPPPITAPTTAPATPPPTTAPPTPTPTTAPPTTAESTMPTVADKTFLTRCTQRCVRSDLVASLCGTGTLEAKCDNLLVAEYVGSYTCCSG
ncbi:salivary glue protein Sgs-3-like [Haliotis cracherodii]|uniref:salivary glue protein Sgs-3-like n=1 Tax=Haliotis cracherodii TaxID=6455 RepID=UPI0039EBF694